MPVLLGFILGVAVTILGVYEYDSSTGRAGNGLSASAAGGESADGQLGRGQRGLAQFPVRCAFDHRQHRTQAEAIGPKFLDRSQVLNPFLNFANVFRGIAPSLQAKLRGEIATQ